VPSWEQIAGELDPTANMFHQQGWIVDHVRRGNISPLEWYPVTIYDTRPQEHAGKEVWKATFRVSNRVLLGDAAGGFLPICSARASQEIADLLGGYVCTATLLDHIAEQGALVDYVRDAYAKVGDLSAANMLANCARFSEVLRKMGRPIGLWTGGKDWIPSRWYEDPKAAGLRNGINTGINYGAHTQAPVGPDGADPARSISLPQLLRVWQPPGGRGKLWHDLDHVDVSQKSPHVLHRAVDISGPGMSATVDAAELAADPQAWRLISHDGPLTLRIPLDGRPNPKPPPGGGGGVAASSGGAGGALATTLGAAGGAALGLGALLLWDRMG